MVGKYWNCYLGAILFLILPIVIFFLTWMEWYIGVPITLFLLLAAYRFCVDANENVIPKNKLIWSKECFVATIIIFMFLLITGHGSFISAVGFDIQWRNAIYYDLIHETWPVIYPKSQGALIYYHIFWLVPAGISYLLDLNTFGSNVVLFVWTFLGLLIFIDNLRMYLQAKSKNVIYMTVIFFLWSGINTIGMLIMSALQYANLIRFKYDAEWGWSLWWYTLTNYSNPYMIRTTFDSLANTYNQFVPLLLVIILFLRFKSLKNILFITLLSLPFSPFGFAGMSILAISEIVIKLAIKYKQNVIVPSINSILNPINIFALLTIFAVFILYYFANAVATDSGNRLITLINFSPVYSLPLNIFILLLYYVLQFGVFMFFCYKNSNEKKFLLVMLGCLVLFPLIGVGNVMDFGWNASLPAFLLLMIFIMKELLYLQENNKIRCKQGITLVVVVCIAATTPILQIGYQAYKCLLYNSTMVSYFHDGFDSTTYGNMDRETAKKNKNFINVEYKNKVFYKYLAKK